MKRKLPNLIKICGIDFNIKYFDHTADVDEDGFKPIMGQCIHVTNEIRILKSKKTATAIDQYYDANHAVNQKITELELQAIDGFDNFQEGKSAELYRKVFKE